jgi:glycosyltransferase involved in cell wall biosynthesis
MKENLKDYFDVTVLPIHINAAIRANPASVKKNFDDICRRLPEFDFVNIQFEGGLYGRNNKEIIKTTMRMISASNKLLITFHRTELAVFSWKRKTVKAFKNFLFDVKHLRFPRLFLPSEEQDGTVTQAVMQMLKTRPVSKPYHIIVHRQLEQSYLQSIHGIPESCITAYPLVYFNQTKQAQHRERVDSSLWKKQKGIPENTLTLGVFGFYGKYKGFPIAIDALTSLPDNYNLAIIGGQHPINIIPHAVDETILGLQSLLKNPHDTTYSPEVKQNLLKRVFFLGAESKDEDLIAAISAVDFVVLPYLEVGQSSSGPASIALELNKPIFLSRTLTFLEFEKFFPKSFEMFDIGNSLELAHKILHYDPSTLNHRRSAMTSYNAEGLADIFNAQCALMRKMGS